MFKMIFVAIATTVGMCLAAPAYTQTPPGTSGSPKNDAQAKEMKDQSAPATNAAPAKPSTLVKSAYASVNGLKMYYEIHGTGKPLVLLHGAFGFVDGWATVLPTLTKTHQVIAIELEGHGHTHDLDRPLTFEQMAEDTALLLTQLKIKDADFFGYSMGGTVALGVAIRHPELVRRLAIYGSCTGKPEDTYDPETYKQYQSLSVDFAPKELKEPYDKMAPDPTRWPVLVTKVKNLGIDFKGYSAAEVKSIKAQVLIMTGDRDVVRPEHAVEMYRLIPNAQLAIFPRGDHFMLWSSPDKLLSTLVPFLDGPMPEQK
jgi:pimeloyl-ACP methyl ester carboxylesterase